MTKIEDVTSAVAVYTAPAPAAVAGLSIMGVPLNEWLLIGSLIALVFQMIVILPKVILNIKAFIVAIRAFGASFKKYRARAKAKAKIKESEKNDSH